MAPAVSSKSICENCKVATLDHIPPDYYAEPPKPAYYKCRCCGIQMSEEEYNERGRSTRQEDNGAES